MAGRGADELAGLAGEQGGDGGGVTALYRLAGQDHGAGIDIGTGQARRPIGFLDEGAEGVRVDRVVGEKGREQDRRGPQNPPPDDDEPAPALVGASAATDAAAYE